MLYTLFLLWTFAVAVPATLLALVVAFQAVTGQVRKLSATTRSTTAGAPAGA